MTLLKSTIAEKTTFHGCRHSCYAHAFEIAAAVGPFAWADGARTCFSKLFIGTGLCLILRC